VSVKTPHKTVKFAGLCVLSAIILSVCVQPVDIDEFMKDDRVVEHVEKGKESVIISSDSDSYSTLRAGNGRISGLNPQKYYMIETEKDENNAVITGYPKFVTDYTGLGPGGLYNDLGFITRISEGIIYGLTNFHTYKIREAAPFSNGTNFSYSEDGVSGTKTASVSNGVITISPDSAGNITLKNLNTSYNSYEIMAVAVTPAVLSSTSPFKSNTKKTINTTTTEFKLEGSGTTIDYVFYKADNPAVFKILTIKIGQPTSLTITLIFNNEERTTAGASANINIGAANGANTASLTVTVSGGVTPESYEWRYNGVPLTGNTSPTLSLSNNAVNPYLVVGTHIFTVIVKIGGAPYSANFTLTVNE